MNIALLFGKGLLSRRRAAYHTESKVDLQPRRDRQTDRQAERAGRQTDRPTEVNEARIHRVEETDRRDKDQVIDEADRQERQTDRQAELSLQWKGVTPKECSGLF